jgi:hypothetical protein
MPSGCWKAGGRGFDLRFASANGPQGSVKLWAVHRSGGLRLRNLSGALAWQQVELRKLAFGGGNHTPCISMVYGVASWCKGRRVRGDWGGGGSSSSSSA